MTFTALTAQLVVTTLAIALLGYPQITHPQVVEPEVAKTVTEAPSVELSVPLEAKPVVASTGDCTPYVEIFNKYDWPTTTAMEICRKESHGYSDAINWNDVHKDRLGNVICVSSRGLMQIACIHPTGLGYTIEDLLDPEKTIAMAYKIWQKSGFCPWTTAYTNEERLVYCQSK